MSGGVLLIVLFGAFLHASWNAIVKGSGDKFFSAASVTGAAGLIALFIVPFLPLPNPASWIYMLLSTVTQTFYMSLVAAAYKSGDMISPTRGALTTATSKGGVPRMIG